MAFEDHAMIRIAAISAAGWLGQYLCLKKQWPPPPQLVGGLILAPVWGGVIFLLLNQMPLSEDAKTALSILAGMACVPLWKIVMQEGIEAFRGFAKSFFGRFQENKEAKQ